MTNLKFDFDQNDLDTNDTNCCLFLKLLTTMKNTAVSYTDIFFNLSTLYHHHLKI